jgi:hypothetical protein
MAVRAGTILTVGGANVIDRIQSAGLGDVRIPVEAIREVGNYLIVDKVPGEPDFTFSMESLDTSVDMMAFLTGKTGTTATASGGAPGAADPDGTVYRWEDCTFVNIASPWKDPDTGSAGVVTAGHLVPGYYPTRISYRFGITDNASQTVELAGGQFYYAGGGRAPVEELFTTANGSTTDFVTTDGTVRYRIGGVDGTTFRNVFGVIVGRQLMVEGSDYTVAGGNGSPATVTLDVAPPSGTVVRVCYFTTVAKAYPQSVHAATVVKPGAVRGRNIKVLLGAAKKQLAAAQSFEMEATIDGTVERELGSEEIVGRTINGTDCSGTITVRSRDADAFIELLSDLTGVATDEVFGYLNQHSIPLEIQIENPKNPGQILKTLYVSDALFQPSGTPARVNSSTDFSIRFESINGTFEEVKGARS